MGNVCGREAAYAVDGGTSRAKGRSGRASTSLDEIPVLPLKGGRPSQDGAVLTAGKGQDGKDAKADMIDAGLPWKYTERGPPVPPCEGDRLQTVRALHLEESMRVEAPPDPEIESILKLVSSVFNAPNALVALFDDKRIFIREALGGFKRGDFPWRFSFCAWTMASQQDTIMVINDATKDPRFANNPFVKAEPGVKFYCGAPLIASNGHRLGTLCFADSKPREMDPQQAMILGNFAEMVVRHVEKDIALQLRSQDNAALSQAYRNLKRAVDCFDHCVLLLDTTKPGWSIMYTNPAWEKLTGSARQGVQGKLLGDVMEMASGVLPNKAHAEAAAVGQEITMEGVRLRTTWLADNALDAGSNSANSSRDTSSSKRFVIRLRPAGQQPLDNDALGLALPPWVAQHAIQDNTGTAYYFMTVEPENRGTRSTMMSARSNLINQSSPLAGLTLGQLLGSGSFGSVYAGQWCGAPVAVKVINQDLRNLQASGVQMEALLGSELRHPHIVSTLTYAVKQMSMDCSTTFTDDTARRDSFTGSAFNHRSTASSSVGSQAAPAPAIVSSLLPFKSKASTEDGNRLSQPGYAVMECNPADFGTPFTDAGTLTGGKVGDMFCMSAHTPSKAPPPAGQQQTWIVLEYCDKGSLQDAVDRGWLKYDPAQLDGAANMAAVVATGLEVASALLYLHSHGIVHGDLSAWNVLLTTSGAGTTRAGRGFTAKVADFGLSRSLDIQTRIQTRTYGTITHQPPETLLEGMVSRETDTYSLGVLLWQMYTGSRPWVGLSHAQIIMSVASRSAALRFPDDTPDDFAALAYACLSYDAKQRPCMSDVCGQLEVMKAKYCSK